MLFPALGGGEQPERWLTDWAEDVLRVGAGLWRDHVINDLSAYPDIIYYLENTGPVGLKGLWQLLQLQSASPKKGGGYW